MSKLPIFVITNLPAVATSASYFMEDRQYTEVCFASFLSGESTTMAVINPPERKFAKRTSVGFWHQQILILEISRMARPEFDISRSNICTKHSSKYLAWKYQNQHLAAGVKKPYDGPSYMYF